MLIANDKTIKEIQETFHARFPQLKIEFYRTAHQVGEGNPNREKLDTALLISQIRSADTTGELSINGHLKVSSLEGRFADTFGLNVQVFRKSGNLWLQTTKTDNWTLSALDKHAAAFVQ